MIEVYFETKGYAELVAVFYNEDVYMSALPSLQEQCLKMGFENVTESVNQ